MLLQQELLLLLLLLLCVPLLDLLLLVLVLGLLRVCLLWRMVRCRHPLRSRGGRGMVEGAGQASLQG